MSLVHTKSFTFSLVNSQRAFILGQGQYGASTKVVLRIPTNLNDFDGTNYYRPFVDVLFGRYKLANAHYIKSGINGRGDYIDQQVTPSLNNNTTFQYYPLNHPLHYCVGSRLIEALTYKIINEQASGFWFDEGDKNLYNFRTVDFKPLEIYLRVTSNSFGVSYNQLIAAQRNNATQFNAQANAIWTEVADQWDLSWVSSILDSSSNK